MSGVYRTRFLLCTDKCEILEATVRRPKPIVLRFKNLVDEDQYLLCQSLEAFLGGFETQAGPQCESVSSLALARSVVYL
jgi:hypothetical protein